MKKNTKYKKYKNGSIYHINYSKTVHPELKEKHLGIIFNINSCENMVFCLPLTSPKEKHFYSKEDFKNRNYNKLKYSHLYYIKETDSIILMEQFRTISKNRIESPYKNIDTKKPIILCKIELSKIIIMFNKFLKNILNNE